MFVKTDARNLLVATAAIFALATAAQAQKDRELDLKVFKVTAPEKWVKKEPRSRIIAYEYGAPAAKGDPADGRFTVMQAGGSVKANVDRWIGQFSQPGGKDAAKVEEKKIKGLEVHLVDISGTYKDRPRGPFGPTVERENYRMLAAIVVTDKAQIFFKFYGPAKTIAEHDKAFHKMIEGLEK